MRFEMRGEACKEGQVFTLRGDKSGAKHVIVTTDKYEEVEMDCELLSVWQDDGGFKFQLIVPSQEKIYRSENLQRLADFEYELIQKGICPPHDE